MEDAPNLLVAERRIKEEVPFLDLPLYGRFSQEHRQLRLNVSRKRTLGNDSPLREGSVKLSRECHEKTAR